MRGEIKRAVRNVTFITSKIAPYHNRGIVVREIQTHIQIMFELNDGGNTDKNVDPPN